MNLSNDNALGFMEDKLIQYRLHPKQETGGKKMNMQKYSTQSMRDDINKFVGTQTHIPFTMRNIYKMLEIVVTTTEQRMDKAIEVIFDKITLHHHENRFGLKGWKTNENYVLNQKFIVPNTCYQDQRWYKGEGNIQVSYGGNTDKIFPSPSLS